MAKKYFAFPSVLLTVGGEVTIEDPSSGQGTPDSNFPCAYSTWQAQFHGDYDHDGDEDFDDYRTWWLDNIAAGVNGFSVDSWNQLNPNDPLNP